MGSSASSPAGSSGPSITNQLSAMNPFASKTPSGPTLGNAYNAQNANAKRAANAASASNAPANPTAGIKTNNAVQAVASSTGSPRIERVSSRMNGGKRRTTRKGSRKNRKNYRR
jgi:type IV secretory pathway TrbL component